MDKMKVATMEKAIRIFHSFEEADAAEAADYLRMTPQERIALVLELRRQFYPDADQQGLSRVYRITELQRS